MIHLQRFWKRHDIVTDAMVNALKRNLGLKPEEGLMIVSAEDHVRGLKRPIPDGCVAWLVVDRRLPPMDGYFLHPSNVRYTTPDGSIPKET